MSVCQLVAPSSSYAADAVIGAIAERTGHNDLTSIKARGLDGYEAACYIFAAIEGSIHVSGPAEPVAAEHSSVSYEAVLAIGSVAPERSLARIYVGDVLDRLTPRAAVQLLQRCRRALAPGGHLRVATDDLDATLDRVSSRETWDRSGLPEAGFDWAASRFHLLNHAFQQRTWFYNETELRRLATMVGLRRGRRVAADDDPRFQAERLRHHPLIMEFERPLRQDGPRPAVDVLIPLYRAEFFRRTLESALEQTWDPLTITICDDGSGDPARAIIDGFRGHRHYSRIQYFRNQPSTGDPTRNGNICLQRSSAPYVKFLFDDDVLEPRCVEKMATCLRDHPDVTLVTSHRRLIDGQDNLLTEMEATRRVVADDSRVSGAWLIDQMLRRQRNFIGEPSTVLFRRQDIQDLLPDFWTLGGINLTGNADVTVWLNLLAQGDGIYLTESLSQFRLHANQTSSNAVNHEYCRAAWHRAARAAAFLGLFDPAPAPPPPLELTVLTDSPWWTPEIRASVQAARLELAAGNASAALAHADRALASESDDPRLTLLRANCLWACGDSSTAIEVLVERVRRNAGAAGPYLRAAEMASALGNRDSAKGVLDGANSKLPLVRTITGAVERDGGMHLQPLARFELIPSLPPVIVGFQLSCHNAAPTPEWPIRVALMLDGVAIAVGELTALGALLTLEATVPTRPGATHLDLRWTGPVEAVPAPTDEPSAVRLVKIDVRLA